jgi:hypothetical protein
MLKLYLSIVCALRLSYSSHNYVSHRYDYSSSTQPVRWRSRNLLASTHRLPRGWSVDRAQSTENSTLLDVAW